jgi:hypothetical protein
MLLAGLDDTLQSNSMPQFPSKAGTHQAMVAHAYNPSYSGGRDHEDYSSKPGWANSSRDPILKKTITKRGAHEVA